MPKDTAVNPFTELGQTGQARISNHIYEDWLPQLRGRQGIRKFREIKDNDATVGSILFAIEMLVRGVEWSTQSASDDTADLAASQFLDDNLSGLEHPFRDTIAQMLSALPFGFSFHETIYRRSEDSRIMWARFGYRPAETLEEWVLDESNQPVGFKQATRQSMVTIPIAKGVHFRLDTSSPSGRSLLRNAYRPWYFKRLTEEKLQIAIDRNLNGIPMARLPIEILSAGDGDARYEMVKKIVTRTKRDEQAGIMWPSDRDPETGQYIYDFELLAPQGDPHFDQVVTVIRMHAADIANTVLAQFTNLGRDSVGSRALAEPQQDLFQSALEAVLDAIQDTLNRQAVKPLFDLNPTIIGIGRPLPKLVHGEVRDVDLEQTGKYLKAVADSGGQWPMEDPRFMSKLGELVGLDLDEDVMSNVERTM